MALDLSFSFSTKENTPEEETLLIEEIKVEKLRGSRLSCFRVQLSLLKRTLKSTALLLFPTTS
jgi:hypothetical protein